MEYWSTGVLVTDVFLRFCITPSLHVLILSTVYCLLFFYSNFLIR